MVAIEQGQLGLFIAAMRSNTYQLLVNGHRKSGNYIPRLSFGQRTMLERTESKSPCQRPLYSLCKQTFKRPSHDGSKVEGMLVHQKCFSGHFRTTAYDGP